MNTLKDLAQFIESETFSILDEDVKNRIVLKLRDTIDDICRQYGLSDENCTEFDYCYQEVRKPNLYHGLTPIDVDAMPDDYEVRWILGNDIQGVIPVVRSGRKYGLFRPSFLGQGMGVMKYFATENPFRYDDVRICVPILCCDEYNGYLATSEKGKWAVWAIDIDTHPLKMVADCNSFADAKAKMEAIIGKPSPYPWMTFDVFNGFDDSLWNTSSQPVLQKKRLH